MTGFTTSLSTPTSVFNHLLTSLPRNGEAARQQKKGVHTLMTPCDGGRLLLIHCRFRIPEATHGGRRWSREKAEQPILRLQRIYNV